MSISEINRSVLQFMRSLQRPFSIDEIHDKLGKDFTKQAVLNAVELLVAQGKAIEKTFTKSKMYMSAIGDENLNPTEVSDFFLFD